MNNQSCTRKELKWYGVLFTCLACRAVYVKNAYLLSNDLFINSLMRFIARHGQVRQLWSDCSTNIVGADRELKELFAEVQMRQENCELFSFIINVPSASHMGGVSERQIGSVRNAMSSLLHHYVSQLEDESQGTLIYEAATIVNSPSDN